MRIALGILVAVALFIQTGVMIVEAIAISDLRQANSDLTDRVSELESSFEEKPSAAPKKTEAEPKAPEKEEASSFTPS